MSNAIPMYTRVGPLRVVLIPPCPFAAIQRLGMLVPEVVATVDKETGESWDDFYQRAVRTAEELNAESK